MSNVLELCVSSSSIKKKKSLKKYFFAFNKTVNLQCRLLHDNNRRESPSKVTNFKYQ
jgi:hypothetical protein